jgi:hypothetical protein
MTMLGNRVLIDSSFLYALYNQTDLNHPVAQKFAKSSSYAYVVPEVALTEVTYLLMRTGGVAAVSRFLASVVKGRIPLESVTYTDIERANSVMTTYVDAKFDFVDCCIMALSERLNIRQICTFDRRDFTMFKPNHCDYLELLP